MTSVLGKRTTSNAEYSKGKTERDSARPSTAITESDISAVGGSKDDGDFSKFPDIPEKSREVLMMKGFTHLFPIQQFCFKPIFSGKDLIGRDLTGSGKTFAFGLPIIESLRKKKLFRTGKVQAIMLAPTRELALQITSELNKVKHSVEEFKMVTVYGGVSVFDQANQLRNGVDLFVGTTGRVLDHIERGNIDFSELKALVLDEADQMLKLGFKEDVEKILGKIREVRSKSDL